MKFKKITALALTATMVLSMTGCTVRIEEVSKKDFFKACKEAGYDEEDIVEIDYDEDDSEGLLYEADLDDDDIFFAYLEFDKEKDARKVFNNWFNDLDDLDTSGVKKYVSFDEYGYYLLDGEFDDEWELLGIEDEAYVGVYFAGKTIVFAVAASDSKKDKETIDDFLDKLEYPKP